jgi:hypothetical protein
MTLTKKLMRFADVSRRLAFTETIYREVGNLWGASAGVHVHIHGVDHDLIHAVGEILGAAAQPGGMWRDGRAATLTVATGPDVAAPRLYGDVVDGCESCRRITGADAPASPEGVP